MTTVTTPSVTEQAEMSVFMILGKMFTLAFIKKLGNPKFTHISLSAETFLQNVEDKDANKGIFQLFIYWLILRHFDAPLEQISRKVASAWRTQREIAINTGLISKLTQTLMTEPDLNESIGCWYLSDAFKAAVRRELNALLDATNDTPFGCETYQKVHRLAESLGF